MNTIVVKRIRTKRLELLRNYFHSCLKRDCLPISTCSLFLSFLLFYPFSVLYSYKFVFLYSIMINTLKALIGFEPMKKSINSTPQWPLCHNTKYGRHDSNMLYISYPKGATDQFVIYHFKFLILSSKGIEPFTALTNSFTENHHYQSDHLPLKYKFLLNNKIIMNSKI